MSQQWVKAWIGKGYGRRNLPYSDIYLYSKRTMSNTSLGKGIASEDTPQQFSNYYTPYTCVRHSSRIRRLPASTNSCLWALSSNQSRFSLDYLICFYFKQKATPKYCVIAIKSSEILAPTLVCVDVNTAYFAQPFSAFSRAILPEDAMKKTRQVLRRHRTA